MDLGASTSFAALASASWTATGTPETAESAATSLAICLTCASHGPMTAEPVPATITLVGAAGAKAKVYALAPDGSRAKRVEAKAEAGALVFTASAADRTIHYEIVRE